MPAGDNHLTSYILTSYNNSLYPLHATMLSSIFCILSPVSCLLPIPYKIMQNKPNFRNDKMNVTTFITRDYENICLRRPPKNKPNSNPIKANLPNAQINVSSFITKDYENKSLLGRRKNKANSNPICRGVASGEAGKNPISKAKKCCCIL